MAFVAGGRRAGCCTTNAAVAGAGTRRACWPNGDGLPQAAADEVVPGGQRAQPGQEQRERTGIDEASWGQLPDGLVAQAQADGAGPRVHGGLRRDRFRPQLSRRTLHGILRPWPRTHSCGSSDGSLNKVPGNLALDLVEQHHP